MTQEEKAKAYDEAIEKAKQTLEASSAPEAKMIVYHFFPKLAESENEDERIINQLITLVNSTGEVLLIPTNKEELVVWLEKQKEQPTNEEMLRTLRAEYEKGVADTIAKYEQKEQKPKRERNKPKESWLEKSKYELAHEEELLTKRQKELSEIRALKDKEQKPADLPPGFYFIDLDGKKYYSKEFRFGDMKMKIVEDKSEKPAEWSEEDEAMLKEIISFFKDGSVKLQHDLDLYAGFLEKRLKSLRPTTKE